MNCISDIRLDMLQANGIAPPPPRVAPAQESRENNKRKSLEQDEVEIKSEDDDDIDRRMDKLKVRLRVTSCFRAELCSGGITTT